MCSFCTMSVEKALRRREGIDRVMVKLVHNVVVAVLFNAVGMAIAALGPFRKWSAKAARSGSRPPSSKLPGIGKVHPEIARKHMRIRYEPASVSPDQIKEAIAKQGYTAVEA